MERKKPHSEPKCQYPECKQQRTWIQPVFNGSVAGCERHTDPHEINEAILELVMET